MRYKTARALEQAVKEAAKKSGRNVNRAITDFYHDRLLERVFSEPEPSFVLKGGRGMLARTTNARYTKDTDMTYEGASVDEAVSELKRLAAIDLDDHLEYRFVSASPIVEDQDYREGCRVVFEAILGKTKKVTDVSVDLVVNDAPLATTDTLTPAARLPIEGIDHFDYIVYPVEESIADKVCATMMTYTGGRESSRVRDLVDLVIYLSTEDLDGDYLARCLDREIRMGHMGERRLFSVPESWRGPYATTYKRLARDSNLVSELSEVPRAESFVASCVNMALDGSSIGMCWDHSTRKWKNRKTLSELTCESLSNDNAIERNPMGEQQFRIGRVKFIDHPILGDLEFDFRGPDGNAVDTVIIAGENGTGKSTLLDILYAITSGSGHDTSYSVEFDIHSDSTEDWHKVSFQYIVDNSWSSTLLVQVDDEPYDGFGTRDFATEFPISAIYSAVDINFDANEISIVGSNTLDTNAGSRKSTQNMPTEINQLLVDIQSQDNDDIANFMREHGDLTFKDYPGEQRITRFKSAFERMFDDTKYLGVRTENGHKVIYFDKNGVEVPIDSLSSGEKQVVYRGSFMLQDAKATEGAFVFIDEPEISLHPSWQMKILDYYKSLFTNEDGVQTSQIFCVTHSPFIIHNDRRRNDKVIVVSRDDNGKICVKERPEYYRCDSMAAVEDAFDFSGFDTGSRTVYVEGQTDERYMNRAMEIFGYGNPFVFREIGNSSGKSSKGSGETNMQRAFEFFSSHQPPAKQAFLFDCDVKTERTEVGNVLRLKHSPYENSNDIRKGIENALILDDIDIRDFYIDHEEKGPCGERNNFQTLDKVGLCEHICSLGDNELRTVFANLLQVINELQAFFG